MPENDPARLILRIQLKIKTTCLVCFRTTGKKRKASVNERYLQTEMNHFHIICRKMRNFFNIPRYLKRTIEKANPI